MEAYHFLREDMTGGYGNEPPWKVGKRREVKGELSLCRWGYHYGFTPANALDYAFGPILCLVEVQRKGPKDGTKGCSRSRKLLKAVNVERILHEAACDIAEDVLPIFEKEFPGDKRPRLAIEAKRKWLKGEITDTELAAARDAAWDAARAAARAAARDAAWDAAWAAAKAAAKAAARDAAWAKYQGWINERLIKALEKGKPVREET